MPAELLGKWVAAVGLDGRSRAINVELGVQLVSIAHATDERPFPAVDLCTDRQTDTDTHITSGEIRRRGPITERGL